MTIHIPVLQTNLYIVNNIEKNLCDLGKVDISSDSSRFSGWYTSSIEVNGKKILDLAVCLPPFLLLKISPKELWLDLQRINYHTYMFSEYAYFFVKY